MRVLLDENLPRRLKQHLGEGIEGVTVPERGWAGIQNGELLRMAEIEFDAFLTTDRSIPHQQNLPTIALAVIVLEASGNRLSDLLPLVSNLQSVLAVAQPGTLHRVTV